MGEKQSSDFGTVTFDAAEMLQRSSPRDSRKSLTITRALGRWIPSEQIAPYCSKKFSLPLECITGADGVRRIVPECNWDELIEMGFVGGLAVIHGLKGYCAEQDEYYYLMFRVLQYVRGRPFRGRRGMKEHLTRRFAYSRDLYVRRTGRVADCERDVLPESVGIASSGEGHRWTAKELIDRGRVLALAQGYRNPTNQRAIQSGMYEAACLDPAEVKDEEVPTLIRLALYDINPSTTSPDSELAGRVLNRLVVLFRKHNFGRDTLDEFEKWFFGQNNTVLKEIAQQKDMPGGTLTLEEVRRAFLELSWQAYEFVGQCVHFLMQAIKNAIPDPLTEEERTLFEHMHERRPYYGNLPLALLAERAQDIGQAVMAIWEEPQDMRHVRVLHRLLQYYAEMAPTRRQVDRRSKDVNKTAQGQSKGRATGNGTGSLPVEATTADNAGGEIADLDSKKPNEGGGSVAMPVRDEPAELLGAEDDAASKARGGCSTNFIENLHSGSVATNDPFQDVAEHIRELKEVSCPQGCITWESCVQDDNADSVTLLFRCTCGATSREVAMSMAEFEGHARKILD